MIFPTHVAGIPCQCRVTQYQEAFEGVWHSNGTGWAPEPQEFEFYLLNTRGYKIPWLEKKLTPADNVRLLKEYQQFLHDSADVEPRDIDYAYA